MALREAEKFAEWNSRCSAQYDSAKHRAGMMPMQTTRFRIWLRDPGITPVWTGVRLVGRPKYVKADCIEVTVEGNGHDLRQLIAKRRDIFAAYLQMKPSKRKDH